MAVSRTRDPVSPTLLDLAPSWRRHLLAENKAPSTVEAYVAALHRLAAYLGGRGRPVAVAAITREHLEEFFADALRDYRPATVAGWFRRLHVFFERAVQEGETGHSPMDRLQAPHVPEAPPQVLAEVQLKRLLKACEGRTFQDRRDTPLVMRLLDTGMRRAELAGLTLEDLDLDANVAVVLGKGRRPRAAPFGARPAGHCCEGQTPPPGPSYAARRTRLPPTLRVTVTTHDASHPSLERPTQR